MINKRIIVRLQLLLLCLLLFISSSIADIVGEINIDTTKWASVAYLSIIPDFTQTTTISNKNIIDWVPISENGKFIFSTEFLPDELHLYRIHISKKGDPPASLTIGGSEHNHFFIFAKRYSNINVKSTNSEMKFKTGVEYSDNINKSLMFIIQLENKIDSLDYYGTSLDKDFYRKDIYSQLRLYADTCLNPLVSLFAVCLSNCREDLFIHPGYYKDYLKKWDTENSNYFQVFRKQVNYQNEFDGTTLIISLIIILAISTVIYYKRQKYNNKNPKYDLTVQERRVFNLLNEGKSNKEIAVVLSVSLSTVKSHINKIYSKLKINSRKELMNLNENSFLKK